MVHFISPTSKLYLVSSPKKFKIFLKELVTCRQGLYDTSASLFLFYGDKNSLVTAGSFVLAIGPTTYKQLYANLWVSARLGNIIFRLTRILITHGMPKSFKFKRTMYVVKKKISFLL